MALAIGLPAWLLLVGVSGAHGVGVFRESHRRTVERRERIFAQFKRLQKQAHEAELRPDRLVAVREDFDDTDLAGLLGALSFREIQGCFRGFPPWAKDAFPSLVDVATGEDRAAYRALVSDLAARTVPAVAAIDRTPADDASDGIQLVSSADRVEAIRAFQMVADEHAEDLKQEPGPVVDQQQFWAVLLQAALSIGERASPTVTNEFRVRAGAPHRGSDAAPPSDDIRTLSNPNQTSSDEPD
jgi:hypothetical protein